MKYVRLCSGLNNRGILVPETEDISKYIKNREKDYYVSLYKYNQQHKDIFDETNSVGGITDTTTDILLWDFDDKNFENVRRDTLELIKRLHNINASSDDIAIFYSGNKGTHVKLQLNEEITPHEFKSITKNLANGLPTYDSSVSNPSRVIRLENTKHQSTGLYKVPISFRQLEALPIDKIRNYASKNHIKEIKLKSINVPRELVKEKEVENKERTITVTQDLDLDYSQKPKWLSHWKYAILNGYFPEGTRSYALMILAATYKAQGLPKLVAYHALKGAAELQSERFEQDKFCKEEIFNNIISQVYAPTWSGGTYAEDNFPERLKNYFEDLGIPRQEETKLEEQQVEMASEGFGEFAEYAKDIDKYTMRFGIPSLDEKLKIRKGHLVGLIAPPGVGKTSISLEILNNMSKSGIHCYFGSFDMYKHNVYQKLIQRHARISEDELFDTFVKRDMDTIEQYKNLLVKNYGNVSFCFKVGQSIDELKYSIKLQEEKLGKPIELVVVDYLELILTKSSDPTSASAEAAQGLREIANEGRVVLMLLQPNKMNSKPNQPITSYSAAKGSSSISQAATAILTAHRPGSSSEFPEEDKFLSMNCVKNRNGALFSVDFSWDGPTQTISELEDIQRQELQELREMIKMRESANKDDL